MDEILKWLPALIAAGSAVWMVAQIKANQLASERRHDASDKRHDSHDSTQRDHDQRLRAAENAITGLKVFDELQQRRKENAP